MIVLPFDSHNHVHMGPTPPVRALLAASALATESNNSSSPQSAPAVLSGMAIMSTHPRDFDRVLHLSKELPLQRPGVQIVPCFGVHPWFLHELKDEDWEPAAAPASSSSSLLPRWVTDMEEHVVANEDAIVGEIGLDGHRFDPVTKELVSPMDKQLEAFRLQLEMAARLKRPVSIHCVRSFGSLMEELARVKKSKHKLPPKLYFHAFGGKAGTVDQLLALCGREGGRVYFGFAPIINFRSPKTADLIRKIGLDHLLLETDHEDAARVPKSIEECIRYISESLDLDEDIVVERTTHNAYDFYGMQHHS